jgi:hypothetical protein
MAYNPRVNVVSAFGRLWVIFLVLLGLLLAACAQGSGTPEIAPSLVPLATVTAQFAATTAAEATDDTAGDIPTNSTPVAGESTPAAAQEPVASPTEVPPAQSISVADQQLRDDGRLLIDRVEANQPGWLVIYSDADGQPGDILGFAEVAQGVSEEVAVEVDPLRSTPHLYALLHVDEGESGVFESPGPDSPVQVDSAAVTADFMVEIIVYLPAVTVADQTLSDEETIVVDSVVSAQKGWIALHLDADGQPGAMLAYLPLEEGETTGLTLGFNWRAATPNLHAVLYEDNGQEDVFEDPEIDLPVQIDGQPVATSFQVILPPDIFVLDQPVVDGQIVVERVISYGPGWIVLYHDDEGSLGNIIGWAALEDGINERIRFPVVESALTPLLHLMVHQDLEEVGEFEFPRTDPPVLYKERVPNPVTFRSDSGSYLITRDQPLSASNTITLPLVVVNRDAFAVIRVDEDGQPGEIWGVTWVPGGVNRDVQVELAAGLRSDILHAELYMDANSDRRFDYPDGLDIAMQSNRAFVRAWFNLLPLEEEETGSP